MIELSENCENCRKMKLREVEENEESDGKCTNAKPSCALCLELERADHDARCAGHDSRTGGSSRGRPEVFSHLQGEEYDHVHVSRGRRL